MESLDDTDIVIGATRWEMPGLAALPEKAWEQHRAKLARHESFSDFVFLRHNKAGELRYLSVSGEPLFDEKGKFSAITASARTSPSARATRRRSRTARSATARCSTCNP